jgi:hypothetical protein
VISIGRCRLKFWIEEYNWEKILAFRKRHPDVTEVELFELFNL